MKNKLREMRQQKNVSVDEMADVLKIKAAAYRRYERGEVDPKISQAVTICDHLKCRLDEIWGNSKVPTEVDLSYKIRPGQTVYFKLESEK